MTIMSIETIEQLYEKVIDENYTNLIHAQYLYTFINYMIKNKNNIYNLRHTSRRKICGKLTISEIWFRLRLYTFNMRPFEIKMRNNQKMSNLERDIMIPLERNILLAIQKM